MATLLGSSIPTTQHLVFSCTMDNLLPSHSLERREGRPTGINNQGVIVGTYFLSSEDPARGFMWKAGVFSNLNPPDAGGHSMPSKISNAGDIVGSYISTADGLQHGFSFDNGKFTTIDAPGLQGTAILGVNKFDNVIAEGAQGTSKVTLKGFCSAVF